MITAETLRPWLGRCAHVKTNDGSIFGSISMFAPVSGMIDVLEHPRSGGGHAPASSHKIEIAKIVEITAAP